jgi:hypothetical protein
MLATTKRARPAVTGRARSANGHWDGPERSDTPRPYPCQDSSPVIGELTGSDTCTAAGVTAHGHTPILALKGRRP